jgi:hypothetical protein
LQNVKRNSWTPAAFRENDRPGHQLFRHNRANAHIRWPTIAAKKKLLVPIAQGDRLAVGGRDVN